MRRTGKIVLSGFSAGIPTPVASSFFLPFTSLSGEIPSPSRVKRVDPDADGTSVPLDTKTKNQYIALARK